VNVNINNLVIYVDEDVELLAHKIAKSSLFTGLARMLMLIRLGLRKKRHLIDAGLGSSTVYRALIDAITSDYIRIVNKDEIVLTEKGEKIADILLEAFKKIRDVDRA